MTDLALKIQSAISKAVNSLGSLSVTATLGKRSTGSYDVSTGSVSTSLSTTSLKVVVDKYTVIDLTNTSIESTDLKVLVIPNVVVPASGDTLTLNSAVFSVLNVTANYVGDKVVLYELQCRK